MEKYYTVEEVAENLKVTKVSVYRWIYQGKLKSTKFGDNHRITDSNIDDFIKESNK